MPDVKAQLQPLAEDLRRIFADRLQALVGYGWRPQPRTPSLALVGSLSFDDLSACATRTTRWHRAGCGTPLILTAQEFARSLDAFPIEYGEILATAQLVAGRLPFEGLAIARDDLRRACEVQAKSHLVHLRENYLERGGRPTAVAEIVRESAPAFAALLRNLARLDDLRVETNADLLAHAERQITLDPRVVGDVLALTEPDTMTSVDASRLFPVYLAAVERVATFVDQWRHRPQAPAQ